MRVIIIGAGVIGLTTAYQLARDEADVTLVEARSAGLGAPVAIVTGNRNRPAGLGG
jgi:glycine/D-amino acid oxidase-like deaminating enzyme